MLRMNSRPAGRNGRQRRAQRHERRPGSPEFVDQPGRRPHRRRGGHDQHQFFLEIGDQAPQAETAAARDRAGHGRDERAGDEVDRAEQFEQRRDRPQPAR